MSQNYYETDRAVSEYLLFHYGTPEIVLPRGGPSEALGFPVRCISECVASERLTATPRGLDLGCAVGRSSFEMARHCAAVVAIDYSARFIAVAKQLQAQGTLEFDYVEEGELTARAKAIVPPEIDRERVSFECGDVHHLRSDLGTFNLVLMANLIDRLREPRCCLEQMDRLVRPGGQLIITSPNTWLEEYTPKANWLGGFERNGQSVQTFASLHQILSTSFEIIARKDLPFLIREHTRKYQWSIAEATVWLRKQRGSK